LAAPFPTVTAQTPALEAARLLAGRNLPGLIVVDERGRPATVSPLVAVAAKGQPMIGAITLDAMLDRLLGT
jgi:CBS domain-containing protein